MARCTHTHPVESAARRAAALALLVALLLSTAGPLPAHAAPAAQAQNLCTLVPAGWDPSYLDDRADYCYAAYVEADGTTLNLKLSKAASPELAYTYMDPKPDDCAAGQTFGGAPCAPVDMGDVAPVGAGHSYKGVTWKNGQGYAWRRGCYLLVGETLWSTQQAKDAQWALMLRADALLAGACPGCPDPSACQGSGTGSGGAGSGSGSGSGTGGSGASPCGLGAPAPSGPFAVSGYGCQYEEADDGVTCQAAVVNACPDADVWYTWSIDGAPYPGYILDVFDPAQLGLCAGDHLVSVYAEDLKNNLKATGMSWSFRSTQGPPCGGAGGTLSLPAPSCSYLAREDRVLCTAQVTDPPDGADIVYEWKWDGTLQGDGGAMLDLLVTPDGKAHAVEVTARDRVSGRVSATASTSVQVGGGGSLQIQTGSGSSGGRPLSPSERLVFAPGGRMAKILADCPLLGLVLLLDVRFDASLRQIESGTSPAEAVVASLLIDCYKLKGKAEAPLQVAAVVDPALFLPAQAAGTDLPVQLRFEMLGGPLRLSAVSDQLLVDVQTSEASVRSAGKNDFGVDFDAQTGATTVAVYGGSVEVFSMAGGAQLAVLQRGEQVTVSQGQAGQVTRAKAGGMSTSTVAVCLLAGAVLLGATIWTVARSQRKRRAAAGAARGAQAPAAQKRPIGGGAAAGAAGPRLAVVSGAARPASVDLSRGPATIGRNAGNSMVVDDPLVSGRHAQVSLEGGCWVVQDLGSTNGTFVGGVRVQRQALRPGDQIQVGRTVIQLLP